VSALSCQGEIFRPRKQSYVRSQAFKSGGQIENDLHSSEIVATNSAKSVDAAQSANGMPIKVVTVICIGRRREKVMFAVNKNRAAMDVYQSGGRVNGVNRVSRRFEQLNCARSHLCDRHNKPFSI